MTVGELIEALKDYDQGATVRFAFPARDYVRSTLAREVESVEARVVSDAQSSHDDPVVIFDEEEAEAELDAHPDLAEECVVLA